VFENEYAVNSKLSSSYRTRFVSTGLYRLDMSHIDYESYLIIDITTFPFVSPLPYFSLSLIT
jgi:hypothetical protein